MKKTLIYLTAALMALLLSFVSCGGGGEKKGGDDKQTISVSLSPKTVTLTTGGTRTFTANVIGTTNTAVNWSATGGSFSGNVYTAPYAAGTYTITATSVADTSKSDTAVVTVSAPPGIGVTVAASTMMLSIGDSGTFEAEVTGATNTDKKWTATRGTIDEATGFYTTPGTPGTCIVIATSVEDNTKSAAITVTVVNGVALNIYPRTSELKTLETATFVAVVSGTANHAVTWTASGGTITQDGTYTAPGTVGTYTVTARSVADSSRSSTAMVTVTRIPDPPTIRIISDVTVLLEGGSTTLTAILEGEGVYDQSFVWESSSPATATVSDGIVTAHKAGNFRITATWVQNDSVSTSIDLTVEQPSSGALRAIPIAATDLFNSANKVVIEDFYREGDINFYLIDAGMIDNIFITNITVPVEYNQQGEYTFQRSITTTESITKAYTETVSESFTYGTSRKLGVAYEQEFPWKGTFKISAEFTWSSSSTNTRTMSASVSEGKTISETVAISDKLTPSTASKGWHRIAMYAKSKIYFIVCTSLDGQELLDWEVVVDTSSNDFFLRKEFSEENRFDNSPDSQSILPDFEERFWRNLPERLDVQVFNFSKSAPPIGQRTLIIPDYAKKAIFIGQFDKKTSFKDYNIVVAHREEPLTIVFQDFGISAPVDTKAVISTSQVGIEIELRGTNSILGGDGGKLSVANNGLKGNPGTAAIDVNGNLTIWGSGSATIKGGNGSDGNRGTHNAHDAGSDKMLGAFGTKGGDGGDAGNAVFVRSLTIPSAVDIAFCGGEGGVGGNGGDGEGVKVRSGSSSTRAVGGNGGRGGNSGAGGHGVVLRDGNLFINMIAKGKLQFEGGDGKQGASGGRGGKGNWALFNLYSNGGNAGRGGDGGNGGVGIHFINQDSRTSYFSRYYDDSVKIIGGKGGNGGTGGRSGYAMKPATRGAAGSGGDGGHGAPAIRIYNEPTSLLFALESGNGGSGGAIGFTDSDGHAPSITPIKGRNGNKPPKSWIWIWP